MWLRACVKCGGDMFLREFEEDKEIFCMQCGYIASPARVAREMRDREQIGRRSGQPAAK